MFLKSLTLKGFKSFADSTTLEFEPGVTVVVGPNGSGKSNVVDAVAWVLGAQGPRTLRSAKMEDVIFAGTPKRAALGRAEVGLTIDNSAGLLPIDFSEVTITRTLFRTGESEYAINRVPCRLLDIQELLSDTGVGRQQHVIVSQGNLEAVLNSRPEERRLVIEEAAGVLKYRRRKEKSERRLDATEASLVRLQDLLREVRRQLRPLEKQADAARRHGDLVAELDGIRRYLAGRELVAVEGRLAACARQRAEIGRNIEAVQESLASHDAEIVIAEGEVSVSRQRDESADLGEALSHAEGLRARAGGLVALLGERRRSIGRDLASTADRDVIASLEAEAGGLTGQLADADAEAERLVPEEHELVEAERAIAAEAAELEARWQPDGPGTGPAVRADPAAETRAELAALRAAVERGQSELRRLDGRQATVDQRAARLAAEAERLRQVIADADRDRAPLARAATEATARLASLEVQLTAAEESWRAADSEHHRWAARADALTQALHEARARAGAERLAQVGGVVGTLLELVEVDPGWEDAFEAAAGEAIAAVVVDSVDTARRGLSELRRLGAAGALISIRDDEAFPTSRPDRAARAGGRGNPLRPHVRAWLPGVDALLDDLLERAVVVEGVWSEALDVALDHPDLVVVTRGGDRFSSGLWRAGATGAGATGAALEEARASTERSVRAAEETGAEFRRLKGEVEGARNARSEAVRRVEASEGRRRAAADSGRRMEGELAEASTEAETAAHQRGEAEQRLSRDRARIVGLESMLPELDAAAAADASQTRAEQAARSRLAERVAAVAALRRDLEVRAAGMEARRTVLASRLAEVETRLQRNVASRNEAASRRGRLEKMATATDRLLVVVTARQERLAVIIDGLRALRRQEAEATRAVSDRLDLLRRQRAGAERQLAEQRERAAHTEMDDTEARLRLEVLTETVRRDLDCEPEATRAAECPALPPGSSSTTRRAELERELRIMGPINPLALEEHTALQDRHQFLEAQLEDVRSARRQLAKVIRAIDAEIVDVFRAAYADVAENFEKLFGTLFPGGRGRLSLTDPDNLLDTGIEVEARPSGKNVKRLSLLSGGERSLTAMAFLFAVFRSRPSPFYLMDEVEAALDDVNLHRFLDLVHEFRAEAQLLIVSHQKRTMEAADCLYGVTMAPGGSSRVISERVSGAVG